MVSHSDSAPQSRGARWPLWVLGGVVALGTGGVCAAGGAYAGWANGSQIAPGVSIANVPVGGLTTGEAREALQTRFEKLPLLLQTGASGFEVDLSEIGGAPAIDFAVQKAAKIGRDGSAIPNFLRVYNARSGGERLALPVRWDKSELLSKLKSLNESYATKAVDARLEVDESGSLVRPESLGKSLNLGATAQQIQTKYLVGTHAIKVYTRQIQPRIFAADLAGEDVLLASYPTRFNPGLAGRTANIRVACAAIEGKVLMPGETFSFNAMTGERTFAKGYRMAHIFETKPGQTEAEIVDGLAGGVCQVSSTLFNAVRRTNNRINDRADAQRLKIVERNSHSLPVTYVPPGLDATVAWPYKDFRFRNNFSHPMYLRTKVSRSRLTIGVWGRVPRSEAGAEARVDENASNRSLN